MVPIARIFVLLFLLTLLNVAGCNAEKQAPSAPNVPKASEQKSEKPSSSALIDINSAGKAELMKLPGIGEVNAQKIIDGRPYNMKSQLKSRNIITDAAYDKIADLIIAVQPK